MVTSTILENVSTDELKNLISESVRVEISKLTPTAPETNNSIEPPIPQPEAIRFLGKSRQTFHSWRKKGIVKAHILGGRVYYFKSELIAAMK